MFGVLVTNPSLVSVTLKNFFPKKSKKYLRKHYELYKVDEISREEFWKRMDVSENQIKNYENQILEKSEMNIVVPDLLKRIMKHYRTAILSNVPKEWGYDVVEKYAFTKYFDEIIFSCDVGFKKPQPEIYEALLKKIPDILPGEILFIDDKSKNLKAAQQFGIKTVLFKIPGNENDLNSDYEITELIELEEILL